MDTVNAIGFCAIYIICVIGATFIVAGIIGLVYKAREKKNPSPELKQFPGHRNPPSPPDPQVSLKDANELAGKSAAKDAERIARLEKEVDTRAMLIAKLTNNKIVNTNTINRLTAENDELTARVRELEGKPKLNNKPVKTTSKNATSGK